MKRGRAWVLGDDVSTDHVISGKFLEIRDIRDLATHVFEGVLDDFPAKVQQDDVIIAGDNFGSGSSREQAPHLLKFLGIGLVVARSFARIFYRNAINVGLPVFVTSTGKQCKSQFKTNDEIEYSIDPPVLKSSNENKHLDLLPNPSFIMEILRDGGAIPSLKRKMERNG